MRLEPLSSSLGAMFMLCWWPYVYVVYPIVNKHYLKKRKHVPRLETQMRLSPFRCRWVLRWGWGAVGVVVLVRVRKL
jgi:hypothetical protein